MSTTEPLPVTCETCPSYLATQIGCGRFCAAYGLNLPREFVGCINHPNFAKLVEENARLREACTDALSISNAAYNEGLITGSACCCADNELEEIPAEQFREIYERIEAKIRLAVYGESEVANV